MVDPNTPSTELTAMRTYAQNAPQEYMIPPGGTPAMEQPEYQNGVIPLDTLPAAWWNWLLYTITEQEKRMCRFFNSIFTEFGNLLTTGGIQSFDETVTNQLVTAIQAIARTPATTLVCGAIKAGTAYGTLAVDQQTGVATVNGVGNGSFNTVAQNVTGAINELDGDIGQEINDRTSADSILQRNIDGKAPINHASSSTDPGTGLAIYGQADATNFGHVKLSDSPNSSLTTTGGTAVTPKALQDVVALISAQQPFLPGFITMCGGATIPGGWLLCDGSAVSRTTYALLFSAIGVTWGVGDGVNTFNLPNLVDRAPMGANANEAANQLGKYQADQVKGHTHSVSGTAAATTDLVSRVTIYGAKFTGAAGKSVLVEDPVTYNLGVGQSAEKSGSVDSNYDHSHAVSGTAASNDANALETRPKNARVNFIIYTGVVPQQP